MVEWKMEGSAQEPGEEVGGSRTRRLRGPSRTRRDVGMRRKTAFGAREEKTEELDERRRVEELPRAAS